MNYEMLKLTFAKFVVEAVVEEMKLRLIRLLVYRSYENPAYNKS